MDLNEQLLANQASSGDSDDRSEDASSEADRSENAAGEMRSAKRDPQSMSTLNQSDGDDAESKAGAIRADQQKKRNALSRVKQAGAAAVSALALTLAGLLRMAWGNLIQSFGLTAIWINIHAFGNMVFGDKVFCPLGEEWQMKQDKIVKGGEASETAGQEQVRKNAGKFIGLFFTHIFSYIFF